MVLRARFFTDMIVGSRYSHNFYLTGESVETDNKRVDNPYDDTFKYRFVKVIYDIVQIKSRAIFSIFLRKTWFANDSQMRIRR